MDPARFNNNYNRRGVTRWRQPSFSQFIVIAGIFLVPVVFMQLFGDILPSSVKIPLFIVWFVMAIVLYFFILSRSKGKEKDTITDIAGLRGNFTVVKSWHYVIAMYLLFFSIGLFVNKFYILGALILFPAAAVVWYGNYTKVKFRIDDYGKFYFIKQGEETFIDFNNLSEVAVKMNKHRTEIGVYKPEIIFYIKQSLTGENYIRLKVPLAKSVEYKTIVAPALVTDFILAKCEANGFDIVYGGEDNLDWTAKRI